MERNDIIRMAREAGLGAALTHDGGEPRVWIEGADWHNELERFAALVAAHEREECAQVVDDFGEWMCDKYVVAKTIRARGEA